MKRAHPPLASLVATAALVALVGTPAIGHAEPASPPPAPAAAPASSPTPDPTPTPDEPRVPVSVAFLYPLATNANLPDVTSNADLSLLYGRVGKVDGLQLGAVAVLATRGVGGAQIGGVTTISDDSVRGLQLAGAVNVATSDVTGAQIATLNVAGPVDGVQLGVINVGRKVRGLQLGVVNIADEVDGAAIGLVSISRDSVHPIVWTSNLHYMNAGVKFSTRYVFTTIAAYYGTLEESFDNVGATVAIGGHVPLPAGFDLEIQGSFSQTAPSFSRSESKGNTWVGHQVVAGYSFARHLRVFAGGGVRLPVSVEIGRDVSRPEALAGVQF